MTTLDQECCPKFDPGKWNNKTFIWDKKPFIKESVPTLFHIPFPPMIGKKMRIMMDLVEKAEANIPDLTDALVLFHDPSPFRSDIYYSVTHSVAGANNTSLSGTFIAEVFDGAYNAVPKHIKIMEKHLARENLKAKDYFVHYAYCPKCAKKYGNNYKILFAEV
ncbi:MAG: hypothetical protein KJN96_00370 [Eudoraea sp.]|nr:hypothetical protein [Eudoraea sp.]MBT8221597.1 hypothetical protein [Eudoraea sp.]NNJ40573.1 hypothetical protein [Eudoraea sp.]